MAIHYLSIFGLAIIAASWLRLYWKMERNKREITREFALLQATGIAILVIDGFLSGAYDLAAMNLVTCGGALLVLSKARK